MAWFTHGPRSPTVSRPARWIIHTDGLVACPGSCRRYRTAPLRLSPVRPPALMRSGSLPGRPKLQEWGGTQACGSAGRRRRVAVLCLTVGLATRTRRRRVDAHRRADRHERVDPPDCRRRAGGAVLPCRREMARGPAHVDNPGVLPLHPSWARAGGRATRSGGDRQCHQPVELADFLAKAPHVWAAGRIQPMAAARVRCPGRLVPTLSHPGAPSRATPGPFRPEPTKRPDLTDRRTKSERAGTTFEAEQWVGRRRRFGGALAVMTGNN